ncbi:MAG: hypothetical protein EPO28_17280 [Saprospiraceae bacterium]|nr:MAG: hypothetical protein EPO28_17280 [Saprospiraceae bacterium]
MFTMKNYTAILLFLAFLLFAAACTEDPPPTLSYQDRGLVDSLYRLQVDTLNPVMDSLCKARFDSAVHHNVDSMMAVRLSEIEEYLERIKRESQQ